MNAVVMAQIICDAPACLQLSPVLHSGDFALFLLTAGVLLIQVECLLPGRVVPGAVGLLLTLFSLHRLSSVPLSSAALLLAAVGGIVIFLGTVTPLPRTSAICGTALLAAGAAALFPTPSGIHVSVIALILGVILGSSTSALLQVAIRARCNKRSSRLAPHSFLAWQPQRPE